jgi:hypothetical protein
MIIPSIIAIILGSILLIYTGWYAFRKSGTKSINLIQKDKSPVMFWVNILLWITFGVCLIVAGINEL